MEEKKNLCAPIPLSLHQRLRTEQEQRGQTLSDYITDILREHFEGGKPTMTATKTLAFQIPEELDLAKMREASKLLIGTHDFLAFCGNRKMKKSTVRNIMAITIVKKEEQVEITITGNGFLQNMVRIIVGTLVEVGLGKRSVESVGEALESRDREQAGYTISPRGLALVGVDYE